MPCGYTIDLARSLVLSRAWGVLSDAELFAHARALKLDTRFSPTSQQLVDFGGVTSLYVTVDGVRTMVGLNPWGRGSRRAAVAPSDLAFGLARMYEALTQLEHGEFQVFRTMNEAMEWLGLTGVQSELLSALAQVDAVVSEGVP